MKITKTKVVISISGLLILMNLVAFFHAWKFTHFGDSAMVRTEDPARLSAIGKVKTLLFGIDNWLNREGEIPDYESARFPDGLSYSVLGWSTK